MDKTIQKTIYKNLFNKTKLESQKISLSVIEDLKGKANAVMQMSENINIDIREYEELTRLIQGDIRTLQEDYDVLVSGLITAREAAEKLGLDISQIPEIQEAEEVREYAESQLQIGENLLNN
jgi:hypothetical protein